MSEIAVEVTLAWPEEALRIEVTVLRGTTVAEAVVAATQRSDALGEALQQLQSDSSGPLAIGVFGKLVEGATLVTAGDRLEIYRPLQRDPRQARRLLASQGLDVTRRGND